MTDFVDGMRQLAHQFGSIPGVLGMHLWSVDLVTATWSGDHPGEATETATVTALTRADGQPPRVKHMNDQQRLMLGIGNKAGYEIGPVTPVVGVSWATLTHSSLADGTTVKIRLTHAESGEVVNCVIDHVDDEKALGVTIKCHEQTSE